MQILVFIRTFQMQRRWKWQ